MTTGCAEYQKKIAALMLGGLDGEEKRALESHLATCSFCRSEQDAYARTVQQLSSSVEEEVPRHFFVYPEDRPLNLRQLFCRMPLRWQTAAAGLCLFVLLTGIAAVSRVQIRSDAGGWAVSFGGGIDAAALKKEMFEAAERRQREAGLAWVREIRDEIARSNKSLTQQQQALLADSLARLDSRLAGRIASSEAAVRDDTQKLVAGMYGTLAQQRAQDLEAINLRFDSTEAKDAIKTRQTNEILGTLLQVADLRLRQ